MKEQLAATRNGETVTVKVHNVYLVKAYSGRHNEWCRVVMTAESAEDAEQLLADHCGRDWSVKSALFLCTTVDAEFWLEV